MKVAQNDETNPNTQPVRPPRVPSTANMQLSPSGSSVRKRETPGILSRMFPPFTGTTSYRVRAHLASRFVMSCIDMHLFALYLLFLPPLLSLDIETDAALVIDYVDDDPPPCQSNQASKPPLSIPISPISFPLMLALELLLLSV